MPRRRPRPKGAGSVRQLPSGRWQARYAVDDGSLVAAPVTFDTKLDASAWLGDSQGRLAVEKRPVYRLRDYAEEWLAGRDLTPRTRAGYRRVLDVLILPALGEAPLGNLSPARVRAWHGKLNPATPTRRTHAYLLLHAIMATALADDLIDANPCRIRGAGRAPRKHQTRVATLSELDTILEAMPPRYQEMVLLAAWCGLRFGELTELRRKDVDLDVGVLRVRRGVVWVGGQFIVGEPKTAAGRRDVAIPPHLLPGLRDHMRANVEVKGDALLFPAQRGGHLMQSSLWKVWYTARAAAGREDLRFHDLRHTGATLAAATGATLADLMVRMGHTTPAAALIYQHSASGRDQAIAAALSGFAEAKTVPLHLVGG